MLHSKPALEWADERLSKLPSNFPAVDLLREVFANAFDAGWIHGLQEMNRESVDMETLRFIHSRLNELDTIYSQEKPVV